MNGRHSEINFFASEWPLLREHRSFSTLNNAVNDADTATETIHPKSLEMKYYVSHSDSDAKEIFIILKQIFLLKLKKEFFLLTF